MFLKKSEKILCNRGVYAFSKQKSSRTTNDSLKNK